MKEGLREKILYLRDVMKLTFRQISEQVGISRKSVSRLYQKGYSIKGRSCGSRLDRYSSLIGNWYQEYPRVKAKQVYAWLKERGIEISYPRVAQYTRDLTQVRQSCPPKHPKRAF
ncbi:MAG: sigma-70 family RNA polymerase sigma factor [Nitrospirae bacterium]|nr:sigma-70 family RNA polymerase sigma factor [Nitrospirota bacterium]